jgi:hypothetical protein
VVRGWPDLAPSSLGGVDRRRRALIRELEELGRVGNRRRLYPVFSMGVNFDSTSKPVCDGTSPTRGGARLLLWWRWPAIGKTTTVDSRRIQGHRCNKFCF